MFLDMGTVNQDAEGAPAVKVVDRRWWARGESSEAEPSPATKPSYVEELEQRLAEKDRLLQGYVEQYKTATAEFEQARLRARREVNREIERGKRTLLLDLLDVVDNLDRAIEAASTGAADGALLAGVKMIRDQFATRLEAHGVKEIAAVGQPFDPQVHEAVTMVPSDDDERIVGVVRRGYRIGDEVLRPAQVAVGKRQTAAD
jgi:molecular chaperone GrpE